MTDAVSALYGAFAAGRPTALPLAAAAGLVTSVGPCAVPRYLAVAALLRGRSPRFTIAAFVAGVVLGYAALGLSADLVSFLIANRPLTAHVLAGILVAFGLVTLMRQPHACAGSADGGQRRPSGAFLLGVSSTVIVSPCCTPIIIAVGGLGANAREPMQLLLVVIAFAVGHIVPLVGTATLGSGVLMRLHHRVHDSVLATVSGSVSLALGGYYGLLA